MEFLKLVDKVSMEVQISSIKNSQYQYIPNTGHLREIRSVISTKNKKFHLQKRPITANKASKVV